MPRVTVIGGGISGLAAAHHLVENAPEIDVIVLEAKSHVGGALRTEHVEGYTIDLGPDSIVADKPWAMDLVRRIGLEGEVIGTREQARGAYVVSRGLLHRVPDGFQLMAPSKFGSVLRSPILSWRGKARLAMEVLLPRGRAADDESLGSFVRRRFGAEVLERLAAPMVSGIYGADPERLSLRATIPRFLEMERKSRSVSLALLRQRLNGVGDTGSGARYGLFRNFRSGMQTLPDRLLALLGPRVRVGHRVEALLPRGRGAWRVAITNQPALDTDGVIVALPARPAAALLRPLDSQLAEGLAAIRQGSCGIITFALPRESVHHPLDAGGFVVPAKEDSRLLACTWSSAKWEGRAPDGKALLRVFVGGAHDEQWISLADEDLVDLAFKELARLVNITAQPLLTRVVRFIDAMPLYEVGHLDRMKELHRRVELHPCLQLAGNSYQGVGIPDSVHSGEIAARRAAISVLPGST